MTASRSWRRFMEQVSTHPAIQAEYERLRAAGESHTIAEMLAYAQPPGVNNTDRAFMEGKGCGEQFEGQDVIGDLYAQNLRDLGGSPKGKRYLHGLAEFPGDPRAWVSGLGEAKAYAESRGWGIRGQTE